MADRRNFPATLVVAGAATAVMLAAFIRNITRVQSGTNNTASDSDHNPYGEASSRGTIGVDGNEASGNERLSEQLQEAENARQEAADLNAFYNSFSSLFYQQLSAVKVTNLVTRIRSAAMLKGKSTSMNFFRSVGGPHDINSAEEEDDENDLQWCDKYLGLQLPFSSKHLRLVHEERHNQSVLLRFIVTQDSAIQMGGGPAANHVPFSLELDDHSAVSITSAKNRNGSHVSNVSISALQGSSGQATRQSSADMALAATFASDLSGPRAAGKANSITSVRSNEATGPLFSSCVTVDVTITVPSMVGESLRRTSALCRKEHSVAVSNYAQVVSAGNIELEKAKVVDIGKTSLFGGSKKKREEQHPSDKIADQEDLDATIDGQVLDYCDDEKCVPKLEYCYVAEKQRLGACLASFHAQSSGSRAPSSSVGRDVDSIANNSNHNLIQTPTWSQQNNALKDAAPSKLGHSGFSSANCSSPGSQYGDYNNARSHTTESFDRRSGFADEDKFQRSNSSVKIIKQVRYVSAFFRSGNGVEVMLTLDIPGPRLQQVPNWFLNLVRGVCFNAFPSQCIPVPTILVSSSSPQNQPATGEVNHIQVSNQKNQLETRPETVLDHEGIPKISGYLPECEMGSSIPLPLSPSASYLYCTEPRYGVSFSLPLGFTRVVDPRPLRSSNASSISSREGSKRKIKHTEGGGGTTNASQVGHGHGSTSSLLHSTLSRRGGSRNVATNSLIESHERWCSAENTASYFFFEGSQAGPIEANEGFSSSPVDLYDARGSSSSKLDVRPQPIVGIVPSGKIETDSASNSIPFLTLKCEFTSVSATETKKEIPQPSSAGTLTARPSDVSKASEALTIKKANTHAASGGYADSNHASESGDGSAIPLIEVPDFRKVKIDHNRILLQARYERYPQPKYGWETVIPKVLRRTAARFRFHDPVIPFVLETQQMRAMAEREGGTKGKLKGPSSTEQIVMRPFESVPSYIKPHGAPRHNLLHRHNQRGQNVTADSTQNEDIRNAEASTLAEEVAMRAAAAMKSFPGAQCFNPDNLNSSGGNGMEEDFNSQPSMGAPLKGYFGAIEVIIKPPRPLAPPSTSSTGDPVTAALYSIGSGGNLNADHSGSHTLNPSGPTSTNRNVFPDDGLGTLTTDGCIRALFCVYVVAVGGEYISINFVAKKTSSFRMKNLLELTSFVMNSASRGNHYGQEPHLMYVQLRHGSPQPFSVVLPAGVQVSEPRLGDPTAVMSLLPEIFGRVVAPRPPPHFSPRPVSQLTIRHFPCHPSVTSLQRSSRERAEALDVFKRECINFIHSLGTSYATLAPRDSPDIQQPKIRSEAKSHHQHHGNQSLSGDDGLLGATTRTSNDQVIIHENPNGPIGGGHVVIVETGVLPSKHRAKQVGASSKSIGAMVGFYFIHHHDLSGTLPEEDHDTLYPDLPPHQDPSAAASPERHETTRMPKNSAITGSRPCVASQDSQPLSHEGLKSRNEIGRSSSLSSPPPIADIDYSNPNASLLDHSQHPFVSSSASSASQRYASAPACQFNPFDLYRAPTPNPLYSKHPIYEAYMMALEESMAAIGGGVTGSFGGHSLAGRLAAAASGTIPLDSSLGAHLLGNGAGGISTANLNGDSHQLVSVTSEAASVSRRTNRSASRQIMSSFHGDSQLKTTPTHNEHSIGAIEEVSDLGATSTTARMQPAATPTLNNFMQTQHPRAPTATGTLDGGETAIVAGLGGGAECDDNDAILRIISIVICVEGCAYVLQASSPSRKDFPKVKRVVLEIAQSWLI